MFGAYGENGTRDKMRTQFNKLLGVSDLNLTKALYVVCFILSSGVTLSLFRIWRKRNAMPYNEAGRYYDGTVVWHEQAVGFYMVLAVVSILVNIVIVMLYWKKHSQ